MARFGLSLVTVLSALASTVLGQQTTLYTDPATGISYQRFHTSSFGGYSFGVAFPQNPSSTSNFIGQIVGPVNGGYSGATLGGGMVGTLIIVAWAQGGSVKLSFRQASGYIEPDISTSAAKAVPMYTTINSTHFSYTFECQGCTTWPGGSFDPNAEFAIFGYAQASDGTVDQTNPNSPIAQHNNGFGQYGVNLPQAKFSQYDAWISAAPKPTTTTTTSTPTSTPTDPPITGVPVPTNDVYDYIVVGGGAGGLIAADKLSEAGKSVLLIERGPPSTWNTGGRNGPKWTTDNSLTRYDVPGLCNQIWVDSVGIACRDISVMAGCVLGGGTAINAGLFFKPPKYDWDHNFPSGWKASDMTGATNRVFNRIPSTDTPSMDGKRYLQESYNLMANILGGSGWSAVTANQSPDAKNRTYAHTPFMYANGMRGGPLSTYFQTAKARGNFKVVMNTMVQRVVRSGAQITGVDVEPTASGGFVGTFKVKPGTGRVILSSGVFGTSKILFRSGIGPEDQLTTVASVASESGKMPAKANWILLPVGYNLMDHNNLDVVISHPSVVPYDFYAAWKEPIPADRTKYLSSRAGPLAGAAPAPNTMFWESVRGPDNIVRQLQWTARVEGSLGASGDNLVTISQYLGTGVTSRGRLGINSALTVNVIDPPYLKNENDIQAVIKGLNSLMVAAKKVSGVTFLFPAPTQTAEQYVRTYTGGQGSNHWMGASKLGTVDGRTTQGKSGCVVDLNTKVYGTNNLFVVDASVFPGHVTTNPSAPIMIMAEKAVEKILALPPPSFVPRYQQCGGINYTGNTVCEPPYTCTQWNDYYHQCT